MSADVDGKISATTDPAADLGSIRNDISGSLGTGRSDSLYARVDLAFSGRDAPSTPLDHSPVHVIASGFYYGDNAHGTLDQQFGSIPAGTGVASSLELGAAKFAFAYDVLTTGYPQLPVSDEWAMRLAPGLALEYLDINVEAQSVASTEKIDDTELLPMVFVQWEFADARFGALVEVGGGSLNDHGVIWDLEGMITYGGEPVGVFVGYRYLNYDTDGSDGSLQHDMDLDIGGWMIGLRATF